MYGITVTVMILNHILFINQQQFIHTVEKPEVVGQPEDKSVPAGETNVNLTVTAKGKSMKFIWRKHGEHSGDITNLEDGDMYHVTELVIKINTVYSGF